MMSLILLLIASGLMYYIESSAQPGSFSSIPAAMWWGVMTMTTVGYGDVYPITPAGKVLAGVIALLGISLFILPAGIIAAGYTVEIQKRKNGHIVCPKCGNVIS
jgi:voltage-gated potassium channel